mmetsp:Transcript_10128/g.12392  ORF Transcript_10128/g.12392 Transcript_10128/m.12392 type:complete len:305 (+) Transcript_10128:69-983(+)
MTAVSIFVLRFALLSFYLRTLFVTGNIDLLCTDHRYKYDNPDSMRKLQMKKGAEFRFCRFQSPGAVKSVFNDCRNVKSFKNFNGRDGRRGSFCTTRLGGDWVLAESEQIAPSCTCEQVLDVYLDGRLQKKWSPDKVIDVKTTLHHHQQAKNNRNFESASYPYYRQDLVLHSQRVITSRTGIMRYSQRILVDKIGIGDYCAFVQLDPDQSSTTTTKKPFNTLSVYVGLQQQGKDVKIYAAGVFEVNRKVVPNLIVFDASGIAGNMAGKGTLWLSGHFHELKASAASVGGMLHGRARTVVDSLTHA